MVLLISAKRPLSQLELPWHWQLVQTHLHSLHVAIQLLWAAADACFLARDWFIHCRCEFGLYFTAVESITLTATKDRMGPGKGGKRMIREESWQVREINISDTGKRWVGTQAHSPSHAPLKDTERGALHGFAESSLVTSLSTCFMCILKPPPCGPGYLSRKLCLHYLRVYGAKLCSRQGERDPAGKFLTLKHIPETSFSNLFLSNALLSDAKHNQSTPKSSILKTNWWIL